mmetsp:Transcript_48483/g.115379  ORF Transcript_48483/g.115379 Transcript_48483/m.115379 type:complete len:217 (+) Transcript_48483:1366-2016(+)
MPSMDPKKRCATLRSASWGHGMYQSMVQQLTSEGNIRRRFRNASPTGEKARTMCRFSRTSCTKCWMMMSLISSFPAAFARGRTSSTILFISSAAKRSGTSPALRRLLMSSRNDSLMIWVSLKRNTVCLFSAPACMSSDFKSSWNSFTPYPRASSIWKHFISAMYAARRVRLCRPDPPTPTRSALPRGWRSRRAMRPMCWIASLKNTRSMGLLRFSV